METLIPVALPPGFARNGTAFQNRNRFVNGNLVRWFEGALRPVGGWAQAVDATGAAFQATGKPRATLAWRKNDATGWLALGCTGTSKLYAFSAAALTDITPVGIAGSSADGSISTGFGAWGAGNWGAGPWGGAGAAGTITEADSWSLDNFGEVLLACLTSDGKIYESTPTAVATQVTNSPTGCRAVVVTPERFVLALGAGSDPRLVQWCSQQARTVWTPAVGNSAGSFPIQTNGRLIAGRRAKGETLLWTDGDLWAAIYIGGNLIYAFQRRGDNCGLVGPNAVCTADDVIYWMGQGRFFSYAGAVRPIPCDVSDYVFGDLSPAQRAKINAVPTTQFGEVTWYYPSASQGGTENDRYVTYNYQSGYWTTGTLARAAGVGASGVFPNPQLWDSAGFLYSHENGNSRGVEAFVETGPLDLTGSQDRVLRIQSLIPDTLQGPLQATFFTRDRPMSAESTFGPYSLTAVTDVRVSGRDPRVKFGDNGAAVDWRLGTVQLGVIPGGQR
jgi:hypothetical protein